MIHRYKTPFTIALIVLIFLSSIPTLHAMTSKSYYEPKPLAVEASNKIITPEMRLEVLQKSAAQKSFKLDCNNENINLFNNSNAINAQSTCANELAHNTRIDHPVVNDIVRALNAEPSISTVAMRINKLTDEIFEDALSCRYPIQKTVQTQIESSIATLERTTNPEELVFHLAVVDHLLSDIDDQLMIKANKNVVVRDRSPALFAQSVQRYITQLYPFAQSTRIYNLLIAAGRFVCDVTIGRLYLSPRDANPRIDKSWDNLKALLSSHNPLNHSDQVFEDRISNLAAHCAADILAGEGLSKAVSYIKTIDLLDTVNRAHTTIAQSSKTLAPDIVHMLQSMLVKLNKIDVSSSVAQSLKPLWSAANALSPESFAQLITSDYIKQIGQCAAKMACASGITGAQDYLKSLNLVSASMGQASQIAQLFIKILDQYLITNPLFITAKGVIILGTQASVAVVQEVLAKSGDAIKIVVDSVQHLMQCKAEGFVKGTPIETAQGIKGIESITSNDKIIRYTPDGKAYECQVLATGNKKISGYVNLVVDGKSIFAGLDQLFRMPGVDNWIAAKHITPAHVLLKENGGHFSVDRAEIINKPTTIYHITVQEHVYGITSDNITVHNMDLGMVASSVGPAVTTLFTGLVAAYSYWMSNTSNYYMPASDKIHVHEDVPSTTVKSPSPINQTLHQPINSADIFTASVIADIKNAHLVTPVAQQETTPSVAQQPVQSSAENSSNAQNFVRPANLNTSTIGQSGYHSDRVRAGYTLSGQRAHVDTDAQVEIRNIVALKSFIQENIIFNPLQPGHFSLKEDGYIGLKADFIKHQIERLEQIKGCLTLYKTLVIDNSSFHTLDDKSLNGHMIYGQQVFVDKQLKELSAELASLSNSPSMLTPSITKLAQNSSNEIPTTQIPDMGPTPPPDMTPEDPKSKNFIIQPQIISALSECVSYNDVAKRLEADCVKVFQNAAQYDHVIDPALSNQIQLSLRALVESKSPENFVFHLTIIENILHDIQKQTALKAGLSPSLLERSPQLFILALEKFVRRLNPVTQIKNQVEFLVNFAQWAVEYTLSPLYLSQEEHFERSVERALKIVITITNLDKVSAEQWVTIGAECAADLVCTLGVGKTLAYLKEIEAISTAQSELSSAAGKLKKGLDAALAERPIFVTAEGIAIQAPKAAEELALLQSNIQKTGGAVKETIKDTSQLIGKTCLEKPIEIFKFSPIAAKHMEETARTIPIQILNEIIKAPVAVVKDPRGTASLMYYAQMWKNGKHYNVEVLYDKTTNTIWHFLYDSQAMGPLPKIIKG